MNDCKVRDSKGRQCGREVTFWHEEQLCAAHKHRLLTHGTFDADRPVRAYTKSELVRGGHPITPGANVTERFWHRVEKTIGCWRWTGTVLNTGYGAMWNGRRTNTAHRHSWEMVHGEIPRGARIVQTCGNSLCVKPAHLEMKGGVRQRQEVAA